MVRRPSVVSLFLLISFASVGAVLYTPALPSIAHYFTVSNSLAQFTVTIFLIGYALGQLPYGPLANRWGRRPTILAGILLSLLGVLLSLIANWSHLFPLLMVGRIVTALGMAAGLVIAFTMIGDLFEGAAARRMISYCTISFSLMPGISVAVGGFLTQNLGWQSCFYALALYCLFMFWLACRLPETRTVDGFRDSFWAQCKDTKLLRGATIMGCGTSMIYLFAARAPFVGIELIKLSPGQYGALYLIPTSGILFGSLLSAPLSRLLPSRPSIAIGLSLALTSALLQLIFFALGWVNPWTLALPTTLLFIGLLLEYTTISGTIMSTAKDKSNASAMMSFLNMGVTTLFVLISNFLFPTSALALPLFFVVLVAIMWLLFLLPAE